MRLFEFLEQFHANVAVKIYNADATELIYEGGIGEIQHRVCSCQNVLPQTVQIEEGEQLVIRICAELMDSVEEKSVIESKLPVKLGNFGLYRFKGREGTLNEVTECIRDGIDLFYPYYQGKKAWYEYSFEKVLEALVKDPQTFSIKGLEGDYSERELEYLEKVRAGLL